jgi:hypothetical protein
MSKKRNISLFCFDCDLDFIIKMNEDDIDNVDLEDLHCPFCSRSVSTEDEEDEEDENPRTNSGDDW